MSGSINLTNSFLLRYVGGFREVTDPASITAHGRIEGLISYGNLSDPAQVDSLAAQVLAHTAVEQLTVTAQVQPASSADTPYQGFDLGDTLTVPTEDGTGTTTDRVVSMSVTTDPEGNPYFAVELGVAAFLAEQRWNNWLQQMLSGTLAGTASSATPLVPPPPQQPASPDEIISFHQPAVLSDGSHPPLQSGLSGVKSVNHTGVLYKVTVTLSGPTPGYGTGPTVLTVYVNGVSIGTVTVATGAQIGVAYFGVPVQAALGSLPDTVSVDFTTVDGVAWGGDVDIAIK